MQDEREGVINSGDRFIETIVALKNGAVLQEMGERLRVLVDAVRMTEKAGALSVTFKVVPAVAGSGEVVTVEADIKEKIPRPSLGKTVFFTGDQGILTRQDPRQLTLRVEREQ